MIISIITINLNNSIGLEKTIESVINQSYSKIEFIVIDGLSNDGSLDLIKQYEKYLTYWVSEKDSGIYNAMNKGIKIAKGDYIIFMNSGDCFNSPSTISEIFNSITDNNLDLIIGHPLVLKGKRLEYEFVPTEFSLITMLNNSINHQSVFIRASLFSEIGLYNEQLKIVSDWEFFLKVSLLPQYQVKVLNKVIAKVDGNGLSATSWTLANEERKAVITQLFSSQLYKDLKSMGESYDIVYRLKSNRLTKIPYLLLLKVSVMVEKIRLWFKNINVSQSRLN